MTSLLPPVREKLTRFGSISVFAVRSFIPFRLLRLQKENATTFRITYDLDSHIKYSAEDAHRIDRKYAL